MGRRIALTVIAAGAAVIGWPASAFATTYNPNAAFLGTGTSLVVPCGSTTITGTGFQPSQFVSVTLGSVTSGATITGPNGSFSTSLTIPPGTSPGTYTLISTGPGGSSASTELFIGKGGCQSVPLLSHSTLVPGESTEVRGTGCVPGEQVVLTIAGRQVGQATANSQGMFSASVTPPGSGVGQFNVTASCGSRSFGVLLSVVSTSKVSAPEGATAVFGVFVLLGFVLLWGQFGSSASRRRRKHVP
jgi:hypothetical protein